MSALPTGSLQVSETMSLEEGCKELYLEAEELKRLIAEGEIRAVRGPDGEPRPYREGTHSIQAFQEFTSAESLSEVELPVVDRKVLQKVA